MHASGDYFGFSSVCFEVAECSKLILETFSAKQFLDETRCNFSEISTKNVSLVTDEVLGSSRIDFWASLTSESSDLRTFD